MGFKLCTHAEEINSKWWMQGVRCDAEEKKPLHAYTSVDAEDILDDELRIIYHIHNIDDCVL